MVPLRPLGNFRTANASRIHVNIVMALNPLHDVRFSGSDLKLKNVHKNRNNKCYYTRH